LKVDRDGDGLEMFWVQGADSEDHADKSVEKSIWTPWR
jgi:hypothetical protein